MGEFSSSHGPLTHVCIAMQSYFEDLGTGPIRPIAFKLD